MSLAPAESVNGHHLLLRAVAAHGLRGSMLDLPEEPLGAEEFALFLSRVQMARLTGLAWQAAVDGALPVTVEQADRIEDLHVEVLGGVLALERLLVETVAVLDDAGVPVRVLKGPALAQLDYQQPAQRTFGDIDLLVPGSGFDDAVRALAAQGHRRNFPEPRPGFDRRFSKGTSFCSADGLEIDLHRTFSMGPLGMRLDLASLWEREETVELGGRVVRTLAREERFLHACFHATLGEKRPRLSPLRDVAQIALRRDLDLDRVRALVRASRAEAVVARAVRAAWSELHLADVIAVSAWAHTHRDAARDAAELAAYGEGSTYASKSAAAIRAVPGWRQRAAYLYALLNPQSSYLGRDASRTARLRRAVQETSRRRSRT